MLLVWQLAHRLPESCAVMITASRHTDAAASPKPYSASPEIRFSWPWQESLGGNAKTMLICNVSPAVAFAEETQMTLEFARSAKRMKNKVQRLHNVEPVKSHVLQNQT